MSLNTKFHTILIVVVWMVFSTTLYWLYKILLSADSGSVDGV